MHPWKHDTGLLRLLADVDRLIRRAGSTLDRLYVLALAERWNAAWLLYFAFARADELLDTPVPTWALHRLRPAGVELSAVCSPGRTRVLRPPPIEYPRNNSFRLAFARC
jgi:hypothetical protein